MRASAAGTGAGADGADGEQGSQAGTASAGAPEAQEAGGPRQQRRGEPAGAAGGSDAAGARDPEQPAPAGGEGLEVYGDSAYGSGEARAAYRDAGHDTVIKPKPLQPAVPGGFTLDDFTINEDERTVTCPAGHVRPMSSKRTVTFGALCAACPLQDRCTTAKDGRSMIIHPHEGLLRQARAQARTEAFKQAYPTRLAIERIISWTATQNGRRVRLRYLGTARNDAWLHTRCARDQPAHPAAPRADAPGRRLGASLTSPGALQRQQTPPASRRRFSPGQPRAAPLPALPPARPLRARLGPFPTPKRSVVQSRPRRPSWTPCSVNVVC